MDKSIPQAEGQARAESSQKKHTEDDRSEHTHFLRLFHRGRAAAPQISSATNCAGKVTRVIIGSMDAESECLIINNNNNNTLMGMMRSRTHNVLNKTTRIY